MTFTGLYVLDSFAFLAFFQAEAGAVRVRQLLNETLRGAAQIAINTVNLGEVIYRTERGFGRDRAQEVLARIDEYQPRVVNVDHPLALAAAHLKARHKMAYADCLAAALAQQLNAPVVTGDADFRKVEHLVTIEWLPGKRRDRP